MVFCKEERKYCTRGAESLKQKEKYRMGKWFYEEEKVFP
jgi:hypothetical protein